MSFINRGLNTSQGLGASRNIYPNVTISLVTTAIQGANNTLENGTRNVVFSNVNVSSGRKSFNDKILLVTQANTSNTNAGIQIVSMSLADINVNQSDLAALQFFGGGTLSFGLFDDPGTTTANVIVGINGTTSNLADAKLVVLRVNNIRNAPKWNDGFGVNNGVGNANLASMFGGICLSTHRDSANSNHGPTAVANGWVELVNRVSAGTFGRGLSIWYRYSSEPNGLSITENWTPAYATVGAWCWLFIR